MLLREITCSHWKSFPMFLRRLFGQNKVKAHTSVQSPGLEGSTQVTPHRESPQKPRLADCLAGDKQDPWETTEAPVGSGAMLHSPSLNAPGKTQHGVSQGGGGTLQEPGLSRIGISQTLRPGPSGYSEGFRSSRILLVLGSPGLQQDQPSQSQLRCNNICHTRVYEVASCTQYVLRSRCRMWISRWLHNHLLGQWKKMPQLRLGRDSGAQYQGSGLGARLGAQGYGTTATHKGFQLRDIGQKAFTFCSIFLMNCPQTVS